jgi:hypothetical protein
MLADGILNVNFAVCCFMTTHYQGTSIQGVHWLISITAGCGYEFL